MTDRKKSASWRFHPIDWSAKGIPIKRSDLNWIADAYLDNDAEYPMYQFQVSTGLGRIVGFWDENGAFNIVLLDRMHNLQPSKFSDYKQRDAPIGENEFAAALVAYEANMKICAPECKCRNLYGEVQSSLRGRLGQQVVLVGLEKSHYLQAIEYIRAGLVDGLGDLVYQGLCALQK